ncbi:uncharacterized protein ACLA_040450 [Aspergillus clavatus NRRL 1]|uniref:Uncharacterized protein n=1 Tax=Aspergillus clavatus (strain ATCC 1007 / CBS 513.65 / DSM 816 / NCTC 3887 / NRRL 1 / QM 1276 / 107) TaxID=344612 RepID=A1CL05_ASPCL|nr:uncharacterized protein ACLA_040450 [Aspergillus clavatus NRRL 1]EAW09829.1 hypothetical protein ACLA_040450 [Aspergillus clavatus NRRL 1]
MPSYSDLTEEHRILSDALKEKADFLEMCPENQDQLHKDMKSLLMSLEHVECLLQEHEEEASASSSNSDYSRSVSPTESTTDDAEGMNSHLQEKLGGNGFDSILPVHCYLRVKAIEETPLVCFNDIDHSSDFRFLVN